MYGDGVSGVFGGGLAMLGLSFTSSVGTDNGVFGGALECNVECGGDDSEVAEFAETGLPKFILGRNASKERNKSIDPI